MKNLIFILLLIINSCVYPDIDTVPKFEDMIISKDEAIELCKINNTSIKDINICLSKINYYKPDESNKKN